MSTGADNLESVKALLLNQRAELRARLAVLQAELRREAEPLSPDFAEQSTQRENEDVAESLRRGTEAELNHIDRALERIRSGRYGICAACGNAIERERLRLVPYAVRCGRCADDRST
jgi:RNA polymerase-binding transcription factor DksA